MKTKICSKCGKEKLLTEFYRERTVKDGRRSSCKECDNKKSKEYYEKHKQKLARKRREYYQNHKKESIAYSREYRQEHLEELRKRQREYYWKHRDEILKKKRERRKRYGKKYVKKVREYQKSHPKVYEAHKKSRWLEMKDRCELCGSTEDLTKHHPDYDYPLVFITVCRECHGWLHRKKT